MNYNIPSNTRIKGILRLCIVHTQDCTHMNDIAYHLCPDFKKKKTLKKEEKKKERKGKKDRPTDPPNFQAKRPNKPFIFFRPKILAMILVTSTHMKNHGPHHIVMYMQWLSPVNL